MWKLRKRWRHAQAVHAQEHDAGIDLSLSCEAVGHSWLLGYDRHDGDPPVTDHYTDIFDEDAERHFLREYRDVKL